MDLLKEEDLDEETKDLLKDFRVLEKEILSLEMLIEFEKLEMSVIEDLIADDFETSSLMPFIKM